MNILAIDTSCDESCASVFDVKAWRLLSNVVHTHIDKMEKYGGIVPEVASREHLRALPLAVEEAFDQAKLQKTQIDWITVTHRPGLIGALLVGVCYAKGLAFALKKPFTVMNHIEAHLFSPLLALADEPSASPPPPLFPWIALVVSGGHTELFAVRDTLDYEWLGGTLDDAAGEAFDKIGKLLGLSYPAGPCLDRWVREKGSESHRSRYAFPRADTRPYCFSYSGLKTAVGLKVKEIGNLSSDERLALASSAQEAILDPMVQKTHAAQTTLGISHVVITGGVACNSRLRDKLPNAYFPKPEYCSDNAAMVALLSGLYARTQRLTPSPWETTVVAHLD